jgi:hypothetical protein
MRSIKAWLSVGLWVRAAKERPINSAPFLPSALPFDIPANLRYVINA